MKKRDSKKKIVAVDLFCGVGGLTHGLVRGGIEVKAGIDIDASCKFPFEANNASRFIKEDISNIKGSDIKSLLSEGNYTLIAGCAPCQPFSTYSRSSRNEKYEAQWPLVLEFGRLIKQTKPDLITMENVPQLVDHQVFQDFLALLKGYSVWWKVVECSSYGVPQTRKRLVLLASRLGDKMLHLPESKSKLSTVKKAISGLPVIHAGERDPNDPLHAAASLSAINLERIRASKPGGTWRDWPTPLQAKCHQRESGSTYPSVYGRMEWDKASPTITTQCFGYGNGRFGHPEQDRAISLREAAMLQTFPRRYKFVKSATEVKFNKLGRLIGNAVPVKLGEIIAKSLLLHVSHYENS